MQRSCSTTVSGAAATGSGSGRGDSRVTIGRSSGADILLDDITVSREHARVVRRPDGFYIEDSDSLNGTYVNRRRVESHHLSDGDELQIGKFKLTYLER